MKTTGYLILIALQLSPMLRGHAQKTTMDKERHKIGFVLGYGDQGGLRVNYVYEVIFLQAQYSYTLWNKKTWSVEIVAQPQYNLTRYQPVNDIPHTINGYEIGINTGCMIKKNIFSGRIGIYFLASIGPHYISGAPKRQSPGFIFSDNLFLGLHIKVADGIYLDIRPGLRHISNASLKKPNGGINTGVVSAGILLIPHSRKTNGKTL